MSVSQDPHTSKAKAVREYARRNWRVLPLCPGKGCPWGDRCPGGRDEGKHPLNKGGVTAASADLGVVEDWWRKWPTANVGVAFAFADWSEWRGAMAQLAVNLSAILLAGITTLFIQRRIYRRRRVAHLHEEARELAGLPVGQSRRQMRVGGSSRPD